MVVLLGYAASWGLRAYGAALVVVSIRSNLSFLFIVLGGLIAISGWFLGQVFWVVYSDFRVRRASAGPPSADRDARTSGPAPVGT